MISSEEQETIIVIPRIGDKAIVSTTDTVMKNKLDKLCESSEFYRCTRTDGEYENFYEIDKSMISFRQKKREVSEEQKQKASERFKQMWVDKKEN